MVRKIVTSQNRSLCEDLGLKWLPGRKKNKARISNKRLFPLYFVYVSTMIIKIITSQNRSIFDDLGLKWLPGPETLHSSLLLQQKKIHYTFFT